MEENLTREREWRRRNSQKEKKKETKRTITMEGDWKRRGYREAQHRVEKTNAIQKREIQKDIVNQRKKEETERMKEQQQQQINA